MRAPWHTPPCISIDMPGKPQEFVLHLLLPGTEQSAFRNTGTSEKDCFLTHRAVQPPQPFAQVTMFMGTAGVHPCSYSCM